MRSVLRNLARMATPVKATFTVAGKGHDAVFHPELFVRTSHTPCFFFDNKFQTGREIEVQLGRLGHNKFREILTIAGQPFKAWLAQHPDIGEPGTGSGSAFSVGSSRVTAISRIGNWTGREKHSENVLNAVYRGQAEGGRIEKEEG